MKEWKLKAKVGVSPTDTRVWLERDDGKRIDLPATSIEVRAAAGSPSRAVVEMHIESLELELDAEQYELVASHLLAPPDSDHATRYHEDDAPTP